MKRVYCQSNRDNPSLVDFYVDGEKIENMFCQGGVRSGKNQVEATARVVATRGTGAGEGVANNENNPATEEGIHLQTEQQQGPTADGTGKDDLSSAKRNRKKAAEKD